MGLRTAICLLCAVLISGCAGMGGSVRSQGKAPSDEEKARTFAEVYRRAKEAGFTTPDGALQTGPDLGQEPPYFPVYTPPRVAKVWVPAHVAEGDQRVMVAGHWTFLVVDEPRWALAQDALDEIEVPFIVPGLPAADQAARP